MRLCFITLSYIRHVLKPLNLSDRTSARETETGARLNLSDRQLARGTETGANLNMSKNTCTHREIKMKGPITDLSLLQAHAGACTGTGETIERGCKDKGKKGGRADQRTLAVA